MKERHHIQFINTLYEITWCMTRWHPWSVLRLSAHALFACYFPVVNLDKRTIPTNTCADDKSMHNGAELNCRFETKFSLELLHPDLLVANCILEGTGGPIVDMDRFLLKASSGEQYREENHYQCIRKRKHSLPFRMAMLSCIKIPETFWFCQACVVGWSYHNHSNTVWTDVKQIMRVSLCILSKLVHSSA